MSCQCQEYSQPVHYGIAESVSREQLAASNGEAPATSTYTDASSIEWCKAK